MLVVALTGNIASGKSAAASRFAEHGATIVDADLLAREVVAPGTPALEAIVARWGPAMRSADGTLDRAALRAIVFQDAGERDALNAIVHPGVEALRRQRIGEARAAGATIVVCVIPLLFETGLDRAFSCIILVDAAEHTRRERLVSMRGLTTPEADRMIAAQLPSEPKRARANYVIDNDGSLAALHAAVDALWRTLEERANGEQESESERESAHEA